MLGERFVNFSLSASMWSTGIDQAGFQLIRVLLDRPMFLRLCNSKRPEVHPGTQVYSGQGSDAVCNGIGA